MHELADAVQDFRLVGLQVPDEVPPEGVTVDGVLAFEVLRPVFTHDPHARLGQNSHVLEGDVLGGRDDGHSLTGLLANARVIRPHGVRRQGR